VSGGGAKYDPILAEIDEGVAADLDAQGSCKKGSIMDIRGTPHLVHLTVALPDARILRVPDARGHRIVSLSGDVWITEEGRQEDIILHAGDAVALQSPGTALVMAFDSADVEIVPPPAPADLTPAWVGAVDHVEQYERTARRLRAEAFGEMAKALGGAVRRIGQRIAAALGGKAARQDPCHGAA
jgi:Protein of unknown function (DUF2917)